MFSVLKFETTNQSNPNILKPMMILTEMEDISFKKNKKAYKETEVQKTQVPLMGKSLYSWQRRIKTKLYQG